MSPTILMGRPLRINSLLPCQHALGWALDGTHIWAVWGSHAGIWILCGLLPCQHAHMDLYRRTSKMLAGCGQTGGAQLVLWHRSPLCFSSHRDHNCTHLTSSNSLSSDTREWTSYVLFALATVSSIRFLLCVSINFSRSSQVAVLSSIYS